MFGHNFKYTFKVLMRSRMLLFWTFVFPLVLGTMFKLAFSNIENSEKLNVIPIAIVDNEDFQGNEAFRRTFETLSDESSDEQMFDTVYVSKDEADTLLSDGDVDGVLYMNGEQPEIWIHENGINQTVLQYVVDEIVRAAAFFLASLWVTTVPIADKIRKTAHNAHTTAPSVISAAVISSFHLLPVCLRP